MKLPLFQQMVDLNRSFDDVAAALQRLQFVPFFQRDLIRHALSDVEIARVYANRDFFDNFEKIVEDDARWAYRFQQKFNRQLKDRDDIYLEVKTSEGRRKRKGLAPRAVILPDWDMSDEDRYDEEDTQRRSRTRSKKSQRRAHHKEARQSKNLVSPPMPPPTTFPALGIAACKGRLCFGLSTNSRKAFSTFTCVSRTRPNCPGASAPE